MTGSVASETASIASIRSSASVASSVRSRRSERSQLSNNGFGGARASSSSLQQDDLEKRACDEDSFSSRVSKSSSSTAKKLGQIAENNNYNYCPPPITSSSASSVASVASSQRSSTSKSSSVGNASRYSTSTVPVSNVTEYSRLGRERYDEGKSHLERGEYIRSISLFTQAVESYQKGTICVSIDQQQTLASIYGRRCEALYAIGAFPASVRDARKALECEERYSSLLSGTGGVGGGGGGKVHPYSNSSSSSSLSYREKLDVETGSPLRAKVLCSLGYSLLGGGDAIGVKAVFQESLNVAKRVQGDAEDLTQGSSPSAASPSTLRQVVTLMKDTVNKATMGLSLLEKYEKLKLKWETKSYMGDNIELLDGILDIAPGAVDWHVSKVIYLIRCQRWFAVANHCEQLATRTMKYEGVFRGDLADMNPFLEGIPPIQDLNSRFFDEDCIGKDKGLPPYLRALSPNAARDAAFRLPKELLLFYLRALRLDERYTSAVKVGMALLEFHEQSKSARYAQEFETLDRTIKVKEQGDKMFRDSNYERALALYGECLNIDGNNESGRKSSILRQPSNQPVACAKANSDGGKLHAVLHSNRAACFMAMGRYEDAIQESSHALLIHSTYTKAILRRARCYAKLGEFERARADYNRLFMLVDGARKFPYPPQYKGSTCFFDMPSDVTPEQLAAMKLEKNSMILHPKQAETMREAPSSVPIPRRRKGRMLNVLGRPKKWFSNCMKNANNQVISSARHRHSGDGGVSESTTTSKNNDRSARRSMKRVSFKSTRSYYQPQNQSLHVQPDPTLANRRPPFEHPIEPPIPIDTTVDYYAILGVPRTATGSDIKRAYHKLALKYHPDRNSSADASAQFQEINRAYAIIGDSRGRKDEYDHKRMDH